MDAARCGDRNGYSTGTQRSICRNPSDQKKLPFKITRKEFQPVTASVRNF